MPVFFVCAGLLGLLAVSLTVSVGRLRMQKKIYLGDGGDPEMLAAIRAHGNFMEYVPLCLALIYFVSDYYGYWPSAIASLILLLSRVLHAGGLLGLIPLGRTIGAAGTTIILAVGLGHVHLCGLQPEAVLTGRAATDGRAGHRSALAVRRDRAVCGLVAARPAADPERPLVRAPPPQPADRPRQPAAGRRDQAVPAHQAPGADRPPGLRPAGGRRRQRLRPRQQPAARGGDDRGPSLCARDRADLQRLYLLQGGLLDRPRRRPLPLPRAPGLRRRAHHGRRGARHHRGVRHEPPQQHGLRAGGLPGGRAHGAQLRRRRMGAHLAIAAAHPLDGRLLRAPQLQQSDLSPGAGALRAHGDRGGRGAGDVSRGRAVARRPSCASPSSACSTTC